MWSGGLQEQEIKAIQLIKDAFSDKQPRQGATDSKGSLRNQLQGAFGRNGMFPWKGYAGFRFVDAKGREGEFDLVIVTHCNVIIVELKDWNHQPVTSRNDTWFKGDKNMGRSPVSVTRNKKFLLENKLKKLTGSFTNKKVTPRVYFFVVMTGDADFSRLQDVEKLHTISLKDFLAFADKSKFNDFFRPHPEAQVLNQDFHVFDELFKSKNTAPKAIRINGYTATEELFEHPKKVYKEYLAASEIAKGTEALLRIWDFKNVGGSKSFTPEGRAQIVSREREVLQFINHQNRDLYNHCLRSLTSFEREEVTSSYSEVYELPPGHVRFNEFVGKFGQSLSEADRLNLAKILLARFADLHSIKIAHRDIADHSLWISPAKEIALSSFISAYHQPIGTVGDYRSSLSVGAVEVREMLDSKSLSPFQQDVHALGLVTWHLLAARRMSPKSLEGIQDEMLSSGEWYAGVLLDAVTAKHRDAAEFFAALMQAQPKVEEIPTFDDGELDIYRRLINHSRQYREDGDFIAETADKEIYISGGRLVKAWLNVGGESDAPSKNFQVLTFLKRVDKLASVSPPYLPKIHEYGLASKSGSMYLVTDVVDGEVWENYQIPEEECFNVIERLVAAVEHLHSLGVSHGDIHPKNVMIGREDNSIFLIDLPDFSANTAEQKNHQYSPENIDGCSPFQRDNFAVLKMSSELLNLEWGTEDLLCPEIAEAIKTELEDAAFGFMDLGRFKKALKRRGQEQELKYIEITVSSATSLVEILPDNGHLYVKVEPQKQGGDVVVTFSGVGGALSAYFDTERRVFVGARPPRIRSSIPPRDIDESQFEVDVAIRVSPGSRSDSYQLTDFLSCSEAFDRVIKSLQEMPAQADSSELSQQVQKAILRAEGSLLAPAVVAPIEIPTRDLWHAVLDTETEASPNIELNEAPLSPADGSAELILPYQGEIDPLGTFTSTDEVEALLIDPDGTERSLGEVSLKKSALGEVRLTKLRFAANGLKDGDTVFFRTKQDRASYRKRKAALERLLDRESVLPDLLEFFDPACERTATKYGIAVTDQDFARYDREDQHGSKISLNEQQREAFAKLVNTGPLSLLQGPPGTGKTEFIAAFTHFLIEKLNVRRILLVSQSHEAVNTAAERIRKHCARLGTPLEVVRFSNREGAVSQGLKDVYSHAITAERRELFGAEYQYRAAALSEALGLDPELVAKVVRAEMKLFRQIDHLDSLLAGFGEVDNEEDIKSLKQIVIELDEAIRHSLAEDHGISLTKDEAISEAKALVFSRLCSLYNVSSNEARRVSALARISRDMQEALAAERVNCDEFYARSRQLVTGTCVGIGQGHIGIQDLLFDFVIIDEAARSISSELAIAMQSAKRILLVGDHLQLPPLYSDAHKSALARRLGLGTNKTDIDAVLRSDFARAFGSKYGAQTSATLLTQYRMAPPIGTLVSETFYDGKLNNGPREVPDIYREAPEALRSAVTWLDTSSLDGRAHHQSDRGLSIYNRCEADQVIDMLKELSLSGQFLAALSEFKEKNDALIGVICMYAEQKRLIRQKFNQEVWSEGFKELVKIDTVDSYQGKENRIIILSLTRSDPSFSPGFLRTPNRINVAMSRAMDRLLIVGNAKMWVGQNKAMPLGKVISFMNEMAEAKEYRFMAAGKGQKNG